MIKSKKYGNNKCKLQFVTCLFKILTNNTANKLEVEFFTVIIAKYDFFVVARKI